MPEPRRRRNPAGRSAPVSSDVAVVVVGAGPHALTLCAHLLDRHPGLADDLAVFDPAGRWLSRWEQRFAALDIGCLRSPAVHHPHPESYALVEFRAARPQYQSRCHLPSRELFSAFCAEVAAGFGLDRAVQPVSVGAVVPTGHGVRLDTDRGPCRARIAVLATNPGRPNIPAWARGRDGVCHAEAVDLRLRRFDDRTVVIVGGGLTAAHMALGVANRGGHAVIVARRTLRVRPFDTDPGWLGPKEMDRFSKEPSFDRRAQLIREARDGGSIPPAYADLLDRCIEDGSVTWRTDTVRCVAPVAEGWDVTLAGGLELTVDEIWLATGWQYGMDAVPLLDAAPRTPAAAGAEGLPGLDPHLAWPGTDLFLMGALAGLQLGPTALNLSGARQGATRITAAIGSRLGLRAGSPIKKRVMQSTRGNPAEQRRTLRTLKITALLFPFLVLLAEPLPASTAPRSETAPLLSGGVQDAGVGTVAPGGPSSGPFAMLMYATEIRRYDVERRERRIVVEGRMRSITRMAGITVENVEHDFLAIAADGQESAADRFDVHLATPMWNPGNPMATPSAVRPGWVRFGGDVINDPDGRPLGEIVGIG